MIDKFKTWALAAGIALTFSASFMLDGPSDHEAAQASAASLADAQAQAQHVAGLTRECHRLRGPSAELVMIRGTDDYACRLPEGGAL